MTNISGKIFTKLKEGRGPVTVVSGGTKYSFKDVEEAKQFWAECYYGSEGAEQARYADIYMQLQNGATKITDGTDDMVPSGSNLFGGYNDVKKTGKYKIFGGYKDAANGDYTPRYDEHTIGGKNDHYKTAEDWLMFFNGHDLARNPEAWKEFAGEMSKAGYNKELAALKNRIETGYGVKLEGTIVGLTEDKAYDERMRRNGKFKKEHPIDDEGYPLKTWYEDNGDNSFTIHLSKADYEAAQEEADLYCDCGSEAEPYYRQNYMGVSHGWVCPDCGKFRQIG